MKAQLGMNLAIERGTSELITDLLFWIAFIQTPKFELENRDEFVGFIQRLARKIGTNVVTHEYSDAFSWVVKFKFEEAYTIKIKVFEYFSARADITEELTEEESAIELKDFIHTAIEAHNETAHNRWAVRSGVSSDLARDLASAFSIK